MLWAPITAGIDNGSVSVAGLQVDLVLPFCRGRALGGAKAIGDRVLTRNQLDLDSSKRMLKVLLGIQELVSPVNRLDEPPFHDREIGHRDAGCVLGSDYQRWPAAGQRQRRGSAQHDCIRASHPSPMASGGCCARSVGRPVRAIRISALKFAERSESRPAPGFLFVGQRRLLLAGLRSSPTSASQDCPTATQAKSANISGRQAFCNSRR